MSVFYDKSIGSGVGTLSEEESRHCFQVLRHQSGDEITILDGIGGIHTCILKEVSKKRCEFKVLETKKELPKPFSIHLAIAPTKNMDRIEWMVEKLAEIGVDQLTFLTTKHSERRNLKLDRLEKKATSAMKQSKNAYKLQLHELTKWNDFLESDESTIKLIAHVDKDHEYISKRISPGNSVTILIGPEGDFSSEEVSQAIDSGYQPVSLGSPTLRTETAGFMACCAVNVINEY